MAVATQGSEDLIQDISLGAMTLTSSKKGLSTGVGEVVTDCKLEEVSKGATQITLELIDREYAALKSGLFKTRIRAELDGCGFRLAELSLLDDFRLGLVMEHELIAEMREYDSPKKAVRGTVTRAQFILSMLRELKLPFRFICPELDQRQGEEKGPEEIKEERSIEDEEERKHGKSVATKLKAAKREAASDGISGLTSKGVQITEEQAQILTEALGVAEGMGSPTLAMEALVVALIQENDISNDSNNSADEGVLSLLASTAAGITKQDGNGSLDPKNVPEVSAHFLAAGFTGAGGAIALAKAHPSYSASKIGSIAQGPEVEYPSTWNEEAKAIVAHYTATGSSATTKGITKSTTVTTVRTAKYEFTRGQPEQSEDTYTCCLRLAEEVGWSFFVVGKRDIYFVNDNDLLRARARYVIEPDTPGLVKLTFDVEVGNRTTIQAGKRRLKPSEAVLMARIDRNDAPPGTVIALKGWGIADGKWLVDDVERSVFNREGQLQLRAPQKPLPEPQATSSTDEENTTKPGAKNAASKIPAGFPPHEGGQFRNPPVQGPTGVTTFKGIEVAKWIVPMLIYAEEHGWTGSITSGYRPGADPHTSTGASEHQGTQYPNGAVDFGGYTPNPSPNRESFFAACAGYTGLPLIPAQFAGDGGHASGTGH